MAFIANDPAELAYYAVGLGIPLLAISIWFWTRGMAYLALRLDLRDIPRGRKDHDRPALLVGGLSLLFGLVAAHLFLLLHEGWRGERMIFLAGALVAGLGGLADDAYKSRRKDLAAGVKLFLQIGAALIPVLAGVQLRLFGDPLWNQVFSILWIVAIINAWNFLDNMDGLAAGVGFFAGLSFTLVFLFLEDWTLAVYAASLAGFCLGFLPHNFPRARFFLGDGASALLGYCFGLLAIQGTYVASGGPGLLAVAVPVAVLAVPLFDMVQVVVTRLMLRKPIYVGDHNHLSHRLARRLGSRQRGSVAIWVLSAVLGGLSVWVPRTSLEGASLLLGVQAVVFGGFLLFSRSSDPEMHLSD